MLSMLQENKANAKSGEEFFDFDAITCEVFVEPPSNGTKGESTFAQDLFLEINKAEPVKLVDLPGIKLTQADRDTINDGAARLEAAYPEMFKPSQRCRVPHLNIDNLREALFHSDVVKRKKLKSAKAMETWLLEQNDRLRDEYTKDGSTKAESVSKTALQKAIKFDFYLGLDSTWLFA